MYDHGTRYSGPFFAAFYARRLGAEKPTDAATGRHGNAGGAGEPSDAGVSGVGGPGPSHGPRIGFTVPRALGGAVVRNRIKRRVREAVRLRLDQLNPQWEIVFNPRRAAMDSPLPDLMREIEKLFLRCNKS